MNRFRFYRKIKGGIWYKHRFTKEANIFGIYEGTTFWARYGNINRYSEVINIEKF